MLPVWKLLGFVLYVILYFNVLEPFERWPHPSLKSCFFKILPILHLILLVISSSNDEEINTKSASYRKQIILGLVFSLGGDIALVYIKDYFELGVMLFAIAQFLYVGAFGFRPFGSGPMAASFGVIGTALYIYLLGDTKEGNDVKVIVLIYTVLIMMMAWRSFALFTANVTIENFCACTGAVLFVISDFILAIDKWKGSFYQAPFWNMTTYYLAQLAIALSACNTHEAKFHSYTTASKHD